MNGHNNYSDILIGPEVLIRLVNTSLTTIPPALFFPVPRSSKTTLDVSGNQLSTLSVQLLATLEDRRGDLKLIGLQSNPVICDCNSRGLRRWLPSHMMEITCSGPPYLAGKPPYSFLIIILVENILCRKTFIGNR